MSKIDVVELSEELCGKGIPLSLFLFTDSVEVCLILINLEMSIE